MIICILGRQPKLGLAELESLYGAAAVRPLGAGAALIDINPATFAHHRLGGVIKAATQLATLPTTRWADILSYLHKTIPEHLDTLPEGKLKLGVSVYNIGVTPRAMQAGLLELKKTIKNTGRSVRIVPNTEPALGSAQVIYNQLTGDLGWELLLIADGNQTHLAQTFSVQDVESYTKRDFGRPNRDAFVGMLPPKLAQAMLNLAGVESGQRVLDPFCGTGVVLQEAALLGCEVYGSDLNEKMVRYTRDNMVWLEDHARISVGKYYEVADATKHMWQQPIDHVVCEAYLGQPLSGLPRPGKLEEIRQDCNTITRKFLENLRPQLKPGTRCCIAVPAWRTSAGAALKHPHSGRTMSSSFLHLPVVDDLNKIGYNRISFSHAASSDLIYHRPDQIVARELLVVTVS